jgi:hypothetical protein
MFQNNGYPDVLRATVARWQGPHKIEGKNTVPTLVSTMKHSKPCHFALREPTSISVDERKKDLYEMYFISSSKCVRTVLEEMK